MFDWQALDKRIVDACNHYEKSAPTVCDYLNDLYIRLNENRDNVRVSELCVVEKLFEEGQWEHPNYAANRIYHLQERIGQSTVGHTGY